jgi:Cu/Ag efflux pump CusA
MVRGRGYAKSIADFENVVLSASESGTPIRVRDIGHVTVGPDLRRGCRIRRRGRSGWDHVMRQGETRST